MLHESDTIYKNVGIIVCISFLIYVLVSVVQIQYDVGSRIATFGSGIIKEGFIEGITNKDRNKDKPGNSRRQGIDSDLKEEITAFEEIVIENYHEADMYTKDDKMEQETSKLAIALMKAKLNDIFSENIKDFVTGRGDMDFSTSSETNNKITLIKTMIAQLEKPM